MQQELSKLIIDLKTKPALVPTSPIFEPMSDKLVSRVTPTNVDKLSTVEQPASTIEENATLLTRSAIKELIRQEKEPMATME